MGIPSTIERKRLLESESPKEALIELYRTKYGWVESMEWIHVSYEPSSSMPIKKRLFVDGRTLPCSCGNKNRIVQRQPSGIVITCPVCRKTNSALSVEEPTMKLLETTFLTVQEACDLCIELGQMIPIGLRNSSKGRRGSWSVIFT